ncbi:MAG: hypothetical protein HY746_08515 [Elusimicrobia bacterium]|nr:hypothetical protein [Elusimicrobiota bacterium]
MRYKKAVFGIFLALVAATVLFFQMKRDAGRIPSDLRDAPGSGAAAGQLGLGNSASEDMPLPAEIPERPDSSDNKSKNSSDDNGVSAPFIWAQLKMAPFKGQTPQDTKQKVHEFFHGIGMKISSYQDNESVRAVEFIPEETPSSGMFGKVETVIADRRIDKKLNALPNVYSATRFKTSQYKYWLVVFKEEMYEDQVDNLFSNIGGKFRLKDYRNRNMKGVWVDLEAAGSVFDLKKTARSLAPAHPDKIYEADVRVEVTTMRMSMGMQP